MMQLQCLTMTMTSKLSNPTLVAAGEGLAWKPHDPPTSESKGMFDDTGNSGKEEVNKDDGFP